MVRDETFLYHVLMVCLTVLRQIKVEMKAVQEVKEVQTLQFRSKEVKEEVKEGSKEEVRKK